MHKLSLHLQVSLVRAPSLDHSLSAQHYTLFAFWPTQFESTENQAKISWPFRCIHRPNLEPEAPFVPGAWSAAPDETRGAELTR